MVDTERTEKRVLKRVGDHAIEVRWYEKGWINVIKNQWYIRVVDGVVVAGKAETETHRCRCQKRIEGWLDARIEGRNEAAEPYKRADVVQNGGRI